MRFPSECCQIHQTLRQTMPQLTEAQSKGLALWTFGTITAKSGCQNAVIAALTFIGGFSAVRQRLREWLYDGADRSTPSQNQIDVRACFAPLMRWVLSLWKSSDLALAIDPTMLSDRLCAIVVSVVYRGCAIPAAWVVMPANKKGKWIDPTVKLLDLLSVAIPNDIRVIVMTDRGLRSPKLWKKIHKLGWHPYMRQCVNTTFCLAGGMRMPARRLVSGPGNSFIGSGTAFRAESKRLKGTIIVIWVEGQDAPWIILTDLPPKEAGASWYEMRFWIETGFKALKSVGWQWQKTRRTDPARVERHWLVLSVATLLTLATGSRVEDAQALKRDPSALRSPPKAAPERNRLVSVFRLGLSMLSRLLTKGRMWRRVWLLPEPWPPPPEGVKVVYHPEPQNLPL